MICCARDLRSKEVVNVKDGSRLGRVDDIEIDTGTLKVLSLVVYGRLRFFGLFGREDDMVIPWEDIEIIGEDTILVCWQEGSRMGSDTRRSFRESWF